MIDKAFKELRFDDVLELLNHFIENNQGLEFYKKSLTILITTLGENHPNVKVVQGNLALAEETLKP